MQSIKRTWWSTARTLNIEQKPTRIAGFGTLPPHSYRADKKVFFTEYPYQADIKVYFTDKEYRAGWKNQAKKPLLY